jgi:hypothetical protein
VIELTSRSKTLPPPPGVLWATLIDPHAPGTRSWLDLRDDETEPTVVEAHEPDLVVWSTLWPDRPGDRIELHISAHRAESRLAFRWLGSEPLPADEVVERRRHRLNELFWADLRYSFGQ